MAKCNGAAFSSESIQLARLPRDLPSDELSTRICEDLIRNVKINVNRNNFYFDEAWATSGNTGVIRWGNTSDAGLPAPNYGTFKTYKQSVANLGTAGLETRPRNIAFNYIVRAD
nr:phage tail protein [Escherichia coli]